MSWQSSVESSVSVFAGYIFLNTSLLKAVASLHVTYHNSLMLHVRHNNHSMVLFSEAVLYPHHIFSSSAKTRGHKRERFIWTQLFSQQKKPRKCVADYVSRGEQTHPATVRHWSSAAMRVGWLVGMRCFRANISFFPSRSWASPRYTELNVPDSEIFIPGTRHPRNQAEFS